MSSFTWEPPPPHPHVDDPNSNKKQKKDTVLNKPSKPTDTRPRCVCLCVSTTLPSLTLNKIPLVGDLYFFRGCDRSHGMYLSSLNSGTQDEVLQSARKAQKYEACDMASIICSACLPFHAFFMLTVGNVVFDLFVLFRSRQKKAIIKANSS